MAEDGAIPTRIVDAEDYIQAIRDIVGEGYEAPLLITGNSMNPFLVHGRDTIMIGRPQMPLQRGDMVFYQRRNGQFVMHRICRIRKAADGRRLYYMAGDAQQELEGPICEAQIFGRVVRVLRKGKWIGKGDFWWEFFEHVWIRVIPFRRCIMHVYGLKRRQ